MSSVSGIGGASSAWASMASSRTSMKEKMFSKIDTDGSGGVDENELQTELDNIAQKTGGTAQQADQVFSSMDTDGNGTLDASELDQGMKSLLGQPSSTVDFAQGRGGMGPMNGPPPGPPPSDDSTSTSSSTSDSSSTTSTSTDPLDTNGDGTVSASERAAGDLQKLLSDLFKAADANGDHSIDGDEATTFQNAVSNALSSIDSTSSSGSSSSTTSSDASTSSSNSGNNAPMDIAAFARLVLQQYQQVAATSATSSGGSGSLSTTA